MYLDTVAKEASGGSGGDLVRPSRARRIGGGNRRVVRNLLSNVRDGAVAERALEGLAEDGVEGLVGALRGRVDGESEGGDEGDATGGVGLGGGGVEKMGVFHDLSHLLKGADGFHERGRNAEERENV
jgi:hypothetical protein